jgi:hypothetical protein
MIHADSVARIAVEVLTDHDLSPSTRALLTLGGIEHDAYFDDDEKLRIVDEVLSEHEAQAVEERNDGATRAIVALRVFIQQHIPA